MHIKFNQRLTYENEREKRDKLQLLHEKLFQECTEKAKKCEELEAKLITSEQTVKSAEYKFEHTKKELKTVKDQYEANEQLIGVLQAKLGYVTKDKDRAIEEVKMAINNLTIATTAKVSTDALNAELLAENEKYKTENQIDQVMISKMRVEDEAKKAKIAEFERERQLYETKKMGLEKDLELTKKTLMGNVNSLEQRLKAESDAKEAWMQRQKEEEKNHSHTRSLLLQAKSQIEDMKLKACNLESDLAAKEKIIKEMNDEKNAINSQLAKMIVEKDNAIIDKQKGEILIKQIEQKIKEKSEKRKEKKKKRLEEMRRSEERFQCTYEDLYSHSVLVFEGMNDTTNKSKENIQVKLLF